LRIVQDVQPDEIYDLAAQSHLGVPSRCQNTPRTRVPWGALREIPQAELTPLHPRSPFGVAKVSIVGHHEGQARSIEIAAPLAAAGLEYFGNLEQFHDSAGAPIFFDAAFVRNDMRRGTAR
jgi:hypothetical protein